ncbi:hypothetical protein TWF696_007178 [Orbilia brochopaga]|uniref:Ubiquitin-like protease family profile domain-containing protein n=1 Tax=Orbilia brochopaga TaxID=3140254 RepID=A0AAV9UUQ5_9PEZI
MIGWVEKGRTSLIAPEGVVTPMPLNGDKEDFGGSSSSPVGQNGSQHPKSSPRKNSKADSASFGQGWEGHKYGNPKGATKISIPGGARPMNNLNPPVKTTNYQQERHRRRHQGNGSLQFAGRPLPRKQDRTKIPASEPDTPINEQLERPNPKPKLSKTEESPTSSTKDARKHEGHPGLSPQWFSPSSQDIYELPPTSHDDLEGNGHSAMREKKGSKPVAAKKSAASVASEGETWKVTSTTDPTKTIFTSKQNSSSLNSTTQSREQRPRKSDTTIVLSTAQRGATCLSSFHLLLRRNDYETIAVFEKSEELPDFKIKLANVDWAAYTDDESHRNYIYIKLRNHENGLAPWVLYLFEGSTGIGPENPSKRDAMRFVHWMEKARIDHQKKPRSFFELRLAEIRNAELQEARRAAAIPQGGVFFPRSPVAQKPESQAPVQHPHVPMPSRLTGATGGPTEPKIPNTPPPRIQTTETTPRRNLRSQTKPVEPVPKPEPYPVQKWDESLKFPFQKRGPCDILDGANLRLLNPDEFLNDEIINFHLAIIRERLQRDNPAFAAKVHIFNTYLYDAYSGRSGDGKTSNYSKVKRWTKDVDIFEKDFVFIPVNEKYHWFLAIVCNLPAAMARAEAKAKAKANPPKTDNERDELVCVESSVNPKPTPKRGGRNPVPADSCAVVILDSMNGVHYNTLRGVKQYLKSEAEDKKNTVLELEDLQSIAPRKIPGQNNWSDCGIFMLHYIEKLLENPNQIKEALYEKEFGTEEASRKLWKISEVTDKRDRMWRLFVRLKQEHDKFLKGEPFDEFPEIEEKPPPTKQNLNGAANDPVVIDDEAKALPKTKDTTAPLDVQRVASPAKRKSDGHEEDSLPAKRTKSNSPGAASPTKRKLDDHDEESQLAKRPKSISPSGAVNVLKRTKSETSDDVVELPAALPAPPRFREKSVEIPYGGEVTSSSKDDPNKENNLQMDVSEFVNSDLPLVAASSPIASRSAGLTEDMRKELGPSVEEAANSRLAIEQVEEDPISQSQTNGINTPTLATTNSFSDLSIRRSETPVVLRQADSIVDDKDTPMPDAPALGPNVEEIDDDDDESLFPSQPLQYGGASRGKSSHELANDRIVDSPSSSQDRRPREKTPSPTKRGDAIHNPIILDSQSSPKRSGLRSSQAANNSVKV